MPNRRQIARDISYSYSASTRGGRAMIRLMENATGRIGLIRRAEGYEHEVAQGRDFWQVMVERYGLGLEVIGGNLDNLPKDGPLIVIANHPYGILDGLMLGHILSVVRGDFVTPGKRLMAVMPLSGVYVDANFKETQIAQIPPGTEVHLSGDPFPDREVTGHVVATAPASGATSPWRTR